MIGIKCEICGDEVLILKTLANKRLCLDCYSKYKDDKTIHKNDLFKMDKQNDIQVNQSLNDNRECGDRRCTNCGRIIPFDSIICPYCKKKFESYL